MQAKNEQLRANLLRSISHDLRTPLTSISGNASVLLHNASSISDEKKQRLYNDIYDDSMWLINLVENLLAVTKIEDSNVDMKLQAELIEDVIAEALRHISSKGAEHHIQVIQSDDLLMAKMNAQLIIQVIINIIDNAIKMCIRDRGITHKRGTTTINSFDVIIDIVISQKLTDSSLLSHGKGC